MKTSNIPFHVEIFLITPRVALFPMELRTSSSNSGGDLLRHEGGLNAAKRL